MRPGRLLLLALALIVGGDVLAWRVQTSGGSVAVRDVRWVGSGGTRMSALLYVPDGATPDTPAPGIVAAHGYINSRETQSGFAIELSRRGFVVLAIDQTGHGYSDPPAFRNGFGGPDALAYLRTLDIVDRDNIGLEGHSMGGWAVLIAAAGAPDDYRSIVIEGSSTGSSGAPAASDTYPRNLAVVFSKYDEFSGGMWGSPVAADVPRGEKLMAAFGTSELVEPGRVYGSIAEGTARIFHQPPVTHPGDHLSRVAIGHAVDWFQCTLNGGSSLPAAQQIWYWKELGTLVALVGMVVLLFAVGGLLLGTPFFAELAGSPPPARGATGVGWWGAALVFAALPAATLFPFKGLGAGWLRPSALFAQSITSQVMVWAVLVGMISAVLFGVWHVASGRRGGAGDDEGGGAGADEHPGAGAAEHVGADEHPGATADNGADGGGEGDGEGAGETADDYGLTWAGRVVWSKVGKSALLAFLIALAAYASLVATAFFFTTDYRFWVFAIKPMSPLQLRISLSYGIPFVAFFMVYGVVLFGQLRRDGGPGREMLRVVALSTLGFVGLIAYQYVPLFMGGTLAIPGESLWSIIAFQFLPIMTIVGLVTAHFQRKTGHVYVGAVLSGLLVTWIVVASQATQFAF